VYPNHLDVMQWLADSNLLEMIVDKLSPSVSNLLKRLFIKWLKYRKNELF